MKHFLSSLITIVCLLSYINSAEKSLHFPGKPNSKHIVFLSGDEEYRSEEGLPMLAQMMNRHHGFECSVLFSLDEQGFVNPENRLSLADSEILDKADLIVMLLRFRTWEDEAMERFEAAYLRGIPIIALRTSSHAFIYKEDSKWHKYSSKSKISNWKKGFGNKVLGEWWGFHHGKHKVEGCRSVIEKQQAENHILNGVNEFFCLADVYRANPPADATILLRGAVTKSLDPKSPNLDTEKNKPMQPIAWTRIVENEQQNMNRVFMCTMGAAIDLKEEGLRRLITNAIFWGFEMDIPEKTNVTIPSSYKPTMYGFKTYKKNKRPVDHIPILDEVE